MLIDTREQRPLPGPERAEWHPNPRLWAWIAVAICFAAAALVLAGFPSFVLMLAALASGCRALTVALPYVHGLQEHRQ